MGMHIDETRSEHSTPGVDDPLRRDVEVWRHGDNATVANGDIAKEPRAAGAIDDPRALD